MLIFLILKWKLCNSSSTPSANPTNSTSSPTSNQIPTNPDVPVTVLSTVPVPISKRTAPIKLLTFHSFSAPPEANKITFSSVFFFIGYPPKVIAFTLALHRIGGLRYLEGEEKGVNATSNCIIDPADESKQGEIVNYKCKVQKKENEIFDQIVVIPDFVFDGEKQNLENIAYSEQAAAQAASLQTQTKILSKIIALENGQLINNYPKSFMVKGNIKNYNGKVGDDDYYIEFINSDESKIIVNCSISNIDSEEYTFECIPKQTINGTLYLAEMLDANTKNSIILNMTQGNDNINFVVTPATSSYPSSSPNQTQIINRPNYKKKSSGLSGSAIAVIILACAVALIIGAIIAMMARKPKAPLDNNTSVTGLKTIDNYSQK